MPVDPAAMRGRVALGAAMPVPVAPATAVAPAMAMEAAMEERVAGSMDLECCAKLAL
jgi:hypothetical protein